MARIVGHGKFRVGYRLFIAVWLDTACPDARGLGSMESETSSAVADRCALSHRVFTSFGDPLFRRAETDAAPVMVVKLGDRQAAIPLRSLQREFGIPDESDDGRMLGLIAQSLDFVAG